jgi:hypothetical protein
MVRMIIALLCMIMVTMVIMRVSIGMTPTGFSMKHPKVQTE